MPNNVLLFPNFAPLVELVASVEAPNLALVFQHLLDQLGVAVVAVGVELVVVLLLPI